MWERAAEPKFGTESENYLIQLGQEDDMIPDEIESHGISHTNIFLTHACMRQIRLVGSLL